MSWITNTCPSQPLPAPIPMVGAEISEVTRAASAAGIFSSTMPKHPASLSRWASRTSFAASASSLARTLYVPNLWIDCGVSPRCPMTGIPAERMRLTDSRISSPPSIFTASASVSFMMRMAESSATFELPW